jgi:hypothetical protein
VVCHTFFFQLKISIEEKNNSNYFFKRKTKKKKACLSSEGMQRCKGGGGTEPFISPFSFVSPELIFACLFIGFCFPGWLL